jgi:mannose-6-phosphate isomerase
MWSRSRQQGGRSAVRSIRGKENILTIEHAIVRHKPKPWGSTDLRPWSRASTGDGPIGELWFERPGLVSSLAPGLAVPETALLLKLLFTSEPLSIQVHPDDAFARSIGLSNGKTEAWYILSAVAGAKVAVGLDYLCSLAELRTAITDGSIANIVHWYPVHRGDVIFIPAGTIHAIGAGIVLAEIQQHSDTTFRLFDYGRQRELHIEHAVAVATVGPRQPQSPPERWSDARLVLTVNPYFALEQIDLAPGSVWTIGAPEETWLLAIEGHAELGPTKLSPGDAVFLQADHANIKAGADGLKALLAYIGPTMNPDALTERSAANYIPRPSTNVPLVPTSPGHAAPEQPEAPNCQS